MGERKSIEKSGPAGKREASARRSQAGVRLGLLGTLVVLQGLFAADAGAGTLAVTRADLIRDKMAKLHQGEDTLQGRDQVEREPRVLQAQWFNWPNWPNWGNWGNWGNWPGWLPQKLHEWRWPRV